MTKSGSILKSNFFDYIIHFIKHLPPGQGPGGKTVFLIMDYHGSRANPAAADYARRHNVVILILPSKTSITSQPNDSSVNMVLATAISRNTKIANMCSTDQMTLIEFLMVLKDTWQEHVQNEASLLLEMRYNKATRGFVKTGLYPLDYDCENWKKAIRFFSSLARLEKQRAEADGLRVSENTWTIKVREDAVFPTDSDIQVLCDNLPVEYNKDDYHHLDLGNLVLHKLLDRYVNDLDRDPDAPPQASNDAERIALTLLRFELANIRVDTTVPTIREKQQQHERNILYSTEINQPINLKDKVKKQKMGGLKLGTDEFFIASSQISLTMEEVLSQYEVLDPSNIIIGEKERIRISRKKRRDRQQEMRELEVKAKMTAREHRRALLRDEFTDRLKSYTNDDGDTVNVGTINTLIDLCQSQYEEVVFSYDPETGKKTRFDVSVTGHDVHASSIMATQSIIESLTKNRKRTEKKQKRNLVFSTKRGGELAVGVMLIQQKLENENIEALKKEVSKLQSKLITIGNHRTVIEKYLLGIKNNNNNNNNTNREDNNNINDDDDVDDRSFDFAEGEPRGGLMSSIAYVLKIKLILRVPAMKDKISKYNKLNICLEYTAMVNSISKIEEKITEKKALLVRVDAEVDSVDLEEMLQELMTRDDDIDDDVDE